MIENSYEGVERRRFPRLAATFGVRMIDVQLKRMDAFPLDTPCYETQFVATDAIGKDISEGGFAFESESKPDVCSIFGLEFFLPEQERHSTSTPNPSPQPQERGFRALGQVVWIAPMDTKYFVGVRFVDVNRPRSAAVRKLVAVHNTGRDLSRFVRGGIRDSLAQG